MTDLKIGIEKVDPLTRGPGAAQELFTRFSRECSKGFSHDDCIGAAANLIMNAIRQGHPKYKDADEALTGLLERCRGVLAQHYNVNGVRRSIFPFDQVIEVPLIKFPKKF